MKRAKAWTIGLVVSGWTLGLLGCGDLASANLAAGLRDGSVTAASGFIEQVFNRFFKNTFAEADGTGGGGDVFISE